MSQTDRRQLKIKASTVKRLKKELDLYSKEYEQEQQKVAKLKEEGADEHDIKYAEKLLSEASMMIPDTRQRLLQAVSDLHNLLGEVSDSFADEVDEVAAAKGVLEELTSVLQETAFAV